jgi:Tfp pilus assembly PilM family ATPase
MVYNAFIKGKGDMNLNKPRVLSISASTTLVRVAQIAASGVVEKIVRKNVEKGAVDAALRQALSGLDVARSSVIWVLPGDVATTKNIEVPSTDNDEIESILALQAPRHTPFNKEEILFSYVKLGSPKPNFSRVLLVIVKRDAVKEKMVILKSAGLKLDSILFAPEGIARFYAQAFRSKKGDAPVAVIDINMQSANFIVLSNGTPVMSRNIPLGIEHFAIDTDAPKQMADEIKASLDAYEQDNIDRKPAKFFFTTNHMALAALPAAIKESVGIQVENQPYTRYVKASKAIQDSLAKDFADDSALDIIAAGVTAVKCQAELIPQEIKDQRSVAEKAHAALKAGVFFLCVLFFIGFALVSKVYFKDQFFKKNLIEKYSAQRVEVKNLESMINRTQILRRYLESRSMPLESVRELFQIIPQEIYLSSVNLDDAGVVSIQGVSDSMSKVFNFVTALEASPLFEGVKTKSTSTRKDRGKEVAAFEIVMKLSSPDAAVPVSAEARDQK